MRLELDQLPVNGALLSLVGAGSTVEEGDMPPPPPVPPSHATNYLMAVKCIKELALFLKPFSGVEVCFLLSLGIHDICCTSWHGIILSDFKVCHYYIMIFRKLMCITHVMFSLLIVLILFCFKTQKLQGGHFFMLMSRLSASAIINANNNDIIDKLTWLLSK